MGEVPHVLSGSGGFVVDLGGASAGGAQRV